MRLTEYIAVQQGESSTDPRITHLERLPQKKWNETYRDEVELPEELLRGSWRQE